MFLQITPCCHVLLKTYARYCTSHGDVDGPSYLLSRRFKLLHLCQMSFVIHMESGHTYMPSRPKNKLTTHPEYRCLLQLLQYPLRQVFFPFPPHLPLLTRSSRPPNRGPPLLAPGRTMGHKPHRQHRRRRPHLRTRPTRLVCHTRRISGRRTHLHAVESDIDIIIQLAEPVVFASHRPAHQRRLSLPRCDGTGEDLQLGLRKGCAWRNVQDWRPRGEWECGSGVDLRRRVYGRLEDSEWKPGGTDYEE